MEVKRLVIRYSNRQEVYDFGSPRLNSAMGIVAISQIQALPLAKGCEYIQVNTDLVLTEHCADRVKEFAHAVMGAVMQPAVEKHVK